MFERGFLNFTMLSIVQRHTKNTFYTRFATQFAEFQRNEEPGRNTQVTVRRPAAHSASVSQYARAQTSAALVYDALSVIRVSLYKAQLENEGVFAGTFRRGQLYNGS